MKPGQIIDCPHCGQNSFLKKESVMDGWTKKGEVLKCSSCGAVIETCAGPEASEAETQPADESAAKRSALAALLGGEEAQVSKDEDFFATEKRFCRDCKHRVMNAFRMRCEIYNRDVNPMDDCPDFVLRSPEQHKETEK